MIVTDIGNDTDNDVDVLFGRNWIVGCICQKWSTASSTNLAS